MKTKIFIATACIISSIMIYAFLRNDNSNQAKVSHTNYYELKASAQNIMGQRVQLHGCLYIGTEYGYLLYPTHLEPYHVRMTGGIALFFKPPINTAGEYIDCPVQFTSQIIIEGTVCPTDQYTPSFTQRFVLRECVILGFVEIKDPKEFTDFHDAMELKDDNNDASKLESMYPTPKAKQNKSVDNWYEWWEENRLRVISREHYFEIEKSLFTKNKNLNNTIRQEAVSK